MSPTRTRMLPDEWPETDRAAWQSALRWGGLFDETGRASHWSPAQRATVEKSYGLWLAFLRRRGTLEIVEMPADRISKQALISYVESLESRKPLTIANRLRDLLEALRVMCPDADLEALRRLVRRLQARARKADRVQPNLVSPSEIYEAGIQRMERVAAIEYEKCDVQAVQFGDGLMMAILAAKPIRRRNIARTVIGTNLVRSGEIYELRYASHETKTKKPIRARLPQRLTAYIDRWLDEFRPVLVRDGDCQTLWVSCYRTAMAESTITARFCQATADEVGVPISPHKVRHIVATGVAAGLPDQALLLPHLLDHVGDATSRKHYVFADNLTASRRYLDVLAERQRMAGGG